MSASTLTLPPPSDTEDSLVTLRLSGGKPMHLRATLVADCSSFSAGAPAWHELALYSRADGGYAASMRTCRAPMGRSDVFHAHLFPDLEKVLDWVEQFDPTCDLDADIDSANRQISTTDIALRAATLRQHADRVSQQYRAMIGELFYRMETGE
jgi:hypothetical protein